MNKNIVTALSAVNDCIAVNEISRTRADKAHNTLMINYYMRVLADLLEARNYLLELGDNDKE